MSINFEFDAPCYVNNSDDPDADRFFDLTLGVKEVNGTSSYHKAKGRNANILERENEDPLNVAQHEETPILRKVLTELVNEKIQMDEGKKQLEDLLAREKNILQGLENLCIKKKNFSKLKSSVLSPVISEDHQNKNSYRKDSNVILKTNENTSVINSRSRSNEVAISLDNQKIGSKGSKEYLFSNAGGMKRKGSPLSEKKKFVSLVERCQHFHYDTPDRYRTIPRNKGFMFQNVKPRQTMPKTPVLTAKYRHRPVNFPDEKQREELELEEMKKHQVKAHPLNEKILKEPVLNLKCPITKKPITVPEPFNLTEIKKKEQPKEKVFVFKAQPTPANILNGPTGIPPKKMAKKTVPLTPNIKIPERLNCENSNSRMSILTPSTTILPRKTKMQPFSFDRKIKDLMMKKQEIIKKVIEEEKKGFNSFKAQPLPSFIGRHNVNILNHSSSSHQMHSGVEQEKSKDGEAVFKAKPATVIHQKPFMPILSHERVLPGDVSLNTEKRAAERRKFDEKMRRREEALAQAMLEQKEEEEKLERMKKLEERKLTEFKAAPMPKYKNK